MADIKPIETVYKGVRFRSRLEARWARYFDALGWPWEYEPEGFQMDGARYLPDFYLPIQDFYVEVKHEKRAKDWKDPMNFYCAGKVFSGRPRCGDYDEHRTDWRLQFGADIGYRKGGLEMDDYLAQMPIPVAGFHARYAGPFFVNCTHGVFLQCENNEHGADGLYKGRDWDNHGADLRAREGIYRKCMSGIKLSNHIFAYIDHPECYGTLAEIGYAAALNKIVHIAFHPSIDEDEFWFIDRMCMPGAWASTEGPAGWVKSLLPSIPADLDKASRFMSEKHGVIVFGQPHNAGRLAYGRGKELRLDTRAAEIARSERFGT